jgi:hypothetical protein
MYIDIYTDIHIHLYTYAAALRKKIIGKWKSETQAILFNPFTICSSLKPKILLHDHYLASNMKNYYTAHI